MIIHKTKPEIIAERLREAIINGQLKGGEQLKQDELAKSFNSSLIPVREALRVLEVQGLIKLYPNKGAIVTQLNLQFHNILYNASKKEILLELIRDMHIRVERYMRIYLLNMGFHKTSQEEHYKLLEACKSKDKDLATKILEEHMKKAKQSFSYSNYLQRISLQTLKFYIIYTGYFIKYNLQNILIYYNLSMIKIVKKQVDILTGKTTATPLKC